jgi:hypothetical protein
MTWTATFMITSADADDMKLVADIPFVPAPGMMVAPAPQADFYRVDEVYWRPADPRILEIFVEHPSPHQESSTADLLAQGWSVQG